MSCVARCSDHPHGRDVLLLSVFLSHAGLFQALLCATALGLMPAHLLLYALCALELVLSIGLHESRRHEYAADRFAVDTFESRLPWGGL